MFLDISGVIHSLLFFSVIVSSIVQIDLVIKRLKSPNVTTGSATTGLYRGYYLATLLGFSLFMIFGFITEKPNYYLVFTRALALVVLVVQLFLFWFDTKNKEDTVLFTLGLLSTTAIFIFAFIGDIRATLVNYRDIFRVLIFIHGAYVCFVIYMQGEKIKELRCLGGLSIRAQILNLFKDVSSVIFAVAMGLSDGLPIFITNFGYLLSRRHIFKVAKCIEK